MKKSIKIFLIFIISIYLCINIVHIIKEKSETCAKYTYNVEIKKYYSNNIYETEEGNYTQEEMEVGDVDFISPDFTYQYSSSDINYGTKTVQIVFDVTDKFYDKDQSAITLDNLAILIKVDDNRIANLSNIDYVEKNLSSEEIYATINGVQSTVIGRRYTLTLSNLEKLQKDEAKTLDYSGILTVAIDAGVVKDITGNENEGETITVGVDIPGGTGTGTIVDVVSPIFEKVENAVSDVNNNTVSMKIKVTDTYYNENSELTSDEITLYINGIEAQDASIEVTKGNTLTEERTIDGVTSTNNIYGQEYIITVSNEELLDINQVKIKIESGAIEDLSGNESKEAQFIMFNCLVETSTETEATSGFLKNTNIERQNIETIQFLDNTTGKNSTVWDVSAVGDNSILAWYEDQDNNGLYEVYIGSEDVINANNDASYLFTFIGYNVDKEGIIQNIELLYTNNVSNMNNMFSYFGYNSETTLDLGSNFYTDQVTTMKNMFLNCGYNNLSTINLGSNFDTSNVINMEAMFKNLGYTKLESLNLLNKFNTENVTNMKEMFSGLGYTKMSSISLGNYFDTSKVQTMESMFQDCGYNSLTSISLGNYFDTSVVTNMSSMFQNCGHEALTSLNLGNNFNTSAVTNMSFMFSSLGYTSMETLTLGENFNTSNVTNMESMFQNTGFTKLRTLELGENFYTSKATNMKNMFYGCGSTAMTVLDLGPAFTKIAETNDGFVTDCGKTGAVINCGESIYYTMYKFKLNTNSETTINYERGTINPKYTPYWMKQECTLDEDSGTVTITLKGTNDYSSSVTSSLTVENIEIYIDNVKTEEITKELTGPTTTTNGVIYKLVLSGFEQGRKNEQLFKEWSGNISIKIDKKVLTDKYGNANMEEIDDETGAISDIRVEDDETNQNTDNTMFVDFISPEFTYKYSNTTIDQDSKILTVEFYVSDKYFKEGNLKLSDLKLYVDGNLVGINVTENSLQTEYIDDKGNVLTDEDIANGETKYGQKFTLVVKNLESAKDGEYEKYNIDSGYVTIIIPSGKVSDYSGNKNISKTITIGIDDPEDENDEAVIVDFVDPTWSYVTSSIDRTTETVSLTIQGTDKYFDTTKEGNGIISKEEITVYLDEEEDISNKISLTLSEPTKLYETRNDTDIQYGVEYTITLGNFQDLSGKVTVVIDENTLFDKSGNSNKSTVIKDGIIDVGNETWVEENEPYETDNEDYPKYTAFRESVVDFINPIITYKYSYEENATDNNPQIDYEEKTLSIVFDVTDKQFLESNLKVTDITVYIDGKNTTGKISKEFSSTVSLNNGIRYTLTLSNIQSETKDLEDEYRDFSGIVQLVFNSDVVEDTSGNKNVAKTIVIDNDDGDDEDNPVIVDVVDPVWEETESGIDYENYSVSMTLRGTDKYYVSNSLAPENIYVYVSDLPNISSVSDLKDLTPIEVTKTLECKNEGNTYVTYSLTLSDFGEENGYVYVLIEQDTLLDLYGNTNENTVIRIGSTTATGVFNEGLVDFVQPEWYYENSYIDRDSETVVVDFYGQDKYIDTTRSESKVENLVNNIDVYIDGEIVTSIKKELTLVSTGSTTMHYELVLSDFGDYNGITSIKLKEGTLYDTSGNTNESDSLNTILVGNESGNGDPAREPTYTVFRQSLVDFIKPEIEYNYENVQPVIDYENRTLQVSIDVTDDYYLKSVITPNDVQIIVDNDESATARVTQIKKESIENGQRITFVISNFEQEGEYGNRQYINYSGMVQIKIPENMFLDTSGNGNSEKLITLDMDDGDDTDNYIIVDLVRPTFYFTNKVVDYEEKRVTIYIRGTDKYYDFDYTISLSDIDIETSEGENLNDGTYNVTMECVQIEYGYEYVITIENYAEEDEIYITIPEQKVYDVYSNYNKETVLTVVVDNQKPLWKYNSVDSSKLDSKGILVFNFSGEDRFLNIDESKLEVADISLYRDGENITDSVTLSLSGPTTEETLKLKTMTYSLTVTGLEEIGAYTIVIAEKVLIDSYENESNTTTFTFSKSALSSTNYAEVTYYTGIFDYTYVNELYNIDETGTNANSEVYNPSSLAELWNDGKNETFIESFEYNAQTGLQVAQSFKGWTEADENGYAIENATVYGLYDEIPSDITSLRVVWQTATVIFVSSSGSNSNNGYSPETPVKDLETAFSKLPSSGTTDNNIIVIMDEITWQSSNDSSELNKDATITNLYAGIDYRTDGACLNIQSNMYMNSNLVFDNIEINSNSNNISRTEYLYNLDASNMLICNYYDLTIGRGVTTTSDYTFGSIIGGNYKTETNTGTIGIHNMRIERGTYNSIIVGSSLSTPTDTEKFVTHNIEIGSKKDGARAQNDKLTINGYLQLAQNEKNYYAYNEEGTQSADTSYSLTYANIQNYSGTYVGENSLNISQADASIYLRTTKNNVEGQVEFEMYGGDVKKSIYVGTMQKADTATDILTQIKFYGGTIENTANIYGQGVENNYIGSSRLTFSGNVTVNGNIYGGANSTEETESYGTTATNILINGSSVNIYGNIYGGSKAQETTSNNVENGYINGSTNIEIKSGNISGNIFGGGENASVGTYNGTLSTEIENAGTTNINITGGVIQAEVYGGSYQNYIAISTNITISDSAYIYSDIFGGGKQENSAQVGIGYTDDTWYVNSNTATELNPNIEDTFGTTNITISGGTIGTSSSNSVYGANKQLEANQDDDNILETTNITIEKDTVIPNVKSIVYGSGVYDNVESTNIYIISSNTTNKLTVYGGSNYESTTEESNVYLQGATIKEIYGGNNVNGETKTSSITTTSGKADAVYGGGNKSSMPTSNININGGTVTNLYGGSNTSGTVETSNINITKGTVTSAYGGGNGTDVTESNIAVTGGTTTTLYGGSNTSGTVETAYITVSKGTVKTLYGGGNGTSSDKSEITLSGGSITSAYGGSYKSDINTSNINLKGATVTYIYGGCGESGTAQDTNIILNSGTVSNVYGGNYIGGNSINTNITIDGTVSIKQNIYGGGYQSEIGKGTVSDSGSYSITEEGRVNLNVVNGRIGVDLNGGSKESVVYGTVNVNIGKSLIETESVASNIKINGDIYGSGSSAKSVNKETGNNYDYNYVSVYGNVLINIDGTNYSTFDISSNIFGAGNAATYSGDFEASIKIENMGTRNRCKNN